MASDVRTFNVTVAAGGGSATNPLAFPVTFPPRVVRTLEIIIPDGNRGSLHFGLGNSGTVIIPSNAGAFIIGNDEKIHWDLDGYPDNGQWVVYAYNTGTLAHMIQLRFLLDVVGIGALGSAIFGAPPSLVGVTGGTPPTVTSPPITVSRPPSGTLPRTTPPGRGTVGEGTLGAPALQVFDRGIVGQWHYFEILASGFKPGEAATEDTPDLGPLETHANPQGQVTGIFRVPVRVVRQSIVITVVGIESGTVTHTIEA